MNQGAGRLAPWRHSDDAPASGRKLLLGLIGCGIQQSLTPALQETEAREQGLRLHYQLIDLEGVAQGPDTLADLLRAARIFGFAGLNITFPYKQAVIPLLDALSPEAQAIGAVNTIVIRDDRLIGHNTDGSGWLRGFRRALPQADLARVVLLGAGGAGAAVAHTLMTHGCGALAVHDVDSARAAALVRSLCERHGDSRARVVTDLAQAVADATGLVHATPTGMAKMPGLPLPAGMLRAALWISEIVYFPIETPLLEAARALGCRVSDGGGMAVGQAIGAFEHFTGLSPDVARMDASFRRLLAARGD